jgi:hypothetical protein
MGCGLYGGCQMVLYTAFTLKKSKSLRSIVFTPFWTCGWKAGLWLEYSRFGVLWQIKNFGVSQKLVLWYIWGRHFNIARKGKI